MKWGKSKGDNNATRHAHSYTYQATLNYTTGGTVLLLDPAVRTPFRTTEQYPNLGV